MTLSPDTRDAVRQLTKQLKAQRRARKPHMTRGWVAAVSVTLTLAGVTVVWALAFLAGAFEPSYQDCAAWAQADGYSSLEAAETCGYLNTWGYDTENITREEYEWNREQFANDMRELESDILDAE